MRRAKLGAERIREANVAAEGKIDPMHQFVIEPIAGSFRHNNPFVFTNSALWTLIVLGTIWLFMFGGMKRELIPGRWQIAVEGLIGFVDDMVNASIGPEGKKYLPWVFTAFIFLLFANFIGNMPFGDRSCGASLHRSPASSPSPASCR